MKNRVFVRRVLRRSVALLMLAAVALPVLAQEEDPALYAVGALGASNLYSSYVVLATVADGYASASYSENTARDLAEESIALHESSVDALRRLVDQNVVSASDRAIVADMIEAHELLIRQAEGLMAYLDDPDDFEAFQRYREAAWEKISTILEESPPE
ncbi:MAG: hypothetical protein ACLFPO_08115 [Spirochaetaceae bacterium]